MQPKQAYQQSWRHSCPADGSSDHGQQHMQRMSEALIVAVLLSVDSARVAHLLSGVDHIQKTYVPRVVTGGLCCLQVAFMEQAAPTIHSLGFVQGRARPSLSPDLLDEHH